MPLLAPPSFSDEELAIIRLAAQPIEPSRRGAFLELVVAGLREPRSPGALLQAAARAQRQFLNEAVGAARSR
jgi:hypothetical protein